MGIIPSEFLPVFFPAGRQKGVIWGNVSLGNPGRKAFRDPWDFISSGRSNSFPGGIVDWGFWRFFYQELFGRKKGFAGKGLGEIPLIPFFGAQKKGGIYGDN